MKIIVDSCCDLTAKTRTAMDITVVPLRIGFSDGTEYTDTPDLNIGQLLQSMDHNKEAIRTSCPTVSQFKEAMLPYDTCIVLTLSEQLSGTYNSACVARDQLLQKYPEKKIYVCNTLSASAGETLIALKAAALRDAGLSFETVVQQLRLFRRRVNTLFVLEDLGNLIKNGRIGRGAGIAASVLSLCPIMSDDGNGNIKAVAKIRGIKNSLKRLVAIIGERTVTLPACSIMLTLSHCDCKERANELALEIMRKCHAIKEVAITACSGISSAYANRGGIIVAFHPVLEEF